MCGKLAVDLVHVATSQPACLSFFWSRHKHHPHSHLRNGDCAPSSTSSWLCLLARTLSLCNHIHKYIDTEARCPFVILISPSINYSHLRAQVGRVRTELQILWCAFRPAGALFLEHLIDGPKWSSFSGTTVSPFSWAWWCLCCAAPLINKAKLKCGTPGDPQPNEEDATVDRP